MVNRKEIVLASAAMCFGFFLVYRATEPIRAERRRTSCYTNLRQIGLGMMQYMNDYDETLPRAWSGHNAGPSDATTNYKWMDAIFPYVKNTKYFTCPSDNINKPYKYRSGTNYGSYVINNAYFLPGDAQTPPAGARADQIVNPALTVLVAEGENDFQVAWPDASHTPQIIGDDPFQFSSIRGRHGAGLYMTAPTVECDGSNSSITLDYMHKTKVVNGQKVYSYFTIEADE